MKLHHKKYKENYKNYILECLDSEDSFADRDNVTRQEKITYLLNKFYNEAGWEIGRTDKDSKQHVMAKWLSGMAIHLPCYYDEMVDLAIQMESVEPTLTESQKDAIIENYWQFMAYMILLLEYEIADVA